MASTQSPEVPAYRFSPRHNDGVDLDPPNHSTPSPDPEGSLSPSSMPLVRKLQQTAFGDRDEHERNKRKTVSRSPTAGAAGGSAMDLDGDAGTAYPSLGQEASQLQSALLRAPMEVNLHCERVTHA